MNDNDSLEQPSVLRYVPSTTTTGLTGSSALVVELATIKTQRNELVKALDRTYIALMKVLGGIPIRDADEIIQHAQNLVARVKGESHASED